MTVQITILHRLPFVSATIYAKGHVLQLNKVLLDTGSAGTVFKTIDLEGIGVLLESTDTIRTMSGVGEGDEYVIEKQIDALVIGDLRVSPFTIQIGALDYGIPMDGIIGVDFLLQAGASIDMKNLTLSKV